MQVGHRGAPLSAGWTHTHAHTHTHEQQRTDPKQKRGCTHYYCKPEQLYAAQRRTMPCADGELCHQPSTVNRTERRKPWPRLQRRMWRAAPRQSRQHGQGPRNEAHLQHVRRQGWQAQSDTSSEEGAVAGPSKRSKRPKNKRDGGGKGSSSSRLRLDNNQKLEILKLIDAKVSYAQIADHLGLGSVYCEGEV